MLLLWAVVSGVMFFGVEWGGDHRWPFLVFLSPEGPSMALLALWDWDVRI